MTSIHRSALLPFSNKQLFVLVNDVEAYPQYMDGCVGASVLHTDGEHMEARLDLSRGGISQSFSTRNRMQGLDKITLELLEGPFEYFEGCWEFTALGDTACKLALKLEFDSNSAVLGAAAAKLFERVTNNLVDALGRRAREMYG